MTNDKPKTDETPKKPKRLNVRVLRAVDAYHVRGVTLSVPDDEYHRGLLKQGNLRMED